MSATSRPYRGELARLLRRPGYVGFALTTGLMRVSSNMFITSGVLLVLARTGSVSLAGWTATAETLPGALTGPWLGAWLDRARHRRRLIVLDQALSIFSLVLLVALAGHAPGFTLPLVASLYSLTRPFSTGGFFAAGSEIAGPELLEAAGTMESVSFNLSFVLGPAVAGALAGAAGAASAVAVQVVLMLLAAVLVAVNPVYDAGPRAPRGRLSLRAIIRPLAADRVLRVTLLCSLLATIGWGMMAIAYPLYAAGTLHAGSHTAGYLWAALALGSAVGTFVLAGPPSAGPISVSYLAVGLSALLWPLAGALWVGVLLVGVTGFLEGPAYSGTLALRQRQAPAAMRAQVMTTVAGVGLIGFSAGTAVAGLIGRQVPEIILFTGLNLVAGGLAWTLRRPGGGGPG